MAGLFKCLEEFISISSAEHDFPLNFFKDCLELQQNLLELQYLIANDPENVVEMKTLLNCMLNSSNSFNNHINEVREFLQFYNHCNQLDQLLKP